MLLFKFTVTEGIALH